QPFAIAAGPDGNIWFTEGADGNTSLEQIGEISPSGTITEYPVPAGTTAGAAIAPGADSNLWFTESNNQIGRVTPSGTFTSFTIPTTPSGPWGIAAGPDGNLWFTEENGDKIGEIASGALPAVQQPPVVTGSGVAGDPLTCRPADWESWAGQQPSGS